MHLEESLLFWWRNNFNVSFIAARLQQNSHPQRRPREDLIDQSQASRPASHEPTDTCPNCLHHFKCNIRDRTDCFDWDWLKSDTVIINNRKPRFRRELWPTELLQYQFAQLLSGWLFFYICCKKKLTCSVSSLSNLCNFDQFEKGATVS